MVSRATEAFCRIDGPVILGSPAVVFRDCPEFLPYVTQVVPVPELNVSMWHQIVDMSVTTQWKRLEGDSSKVWVVAVLRERD